MPARKNPEKIIMGNYRKSLRNKCEYTTEIIRGNGGIFLVSEAKLESSSTYVVLYPKLLKTLQARPNWKRWGNDATYKEHIQSKLFKCFTNIDNEIYLFEVSATEEP